MLPKQAQRLLDFIYEYKTENDGNAPPHRLMFLAIDAHSSNASAYWVDFLVEKGFLTKKRGKLCVVGARWVPPMKKLDWEKVKDILALQYYRPGGYSNVEEDIGHTLKDLHELLDPYLGDVQEQSSRCAWKYCEEYASDYWETDCGEAHILANNMRFCPYCGRRIEQLDQDEKGE